MKLLGSNRIKLNLSIDIIMFLLLVPLAGIGFLMKYVLISGQERNILYGTKVDLEFLGLTRHQWGTIHLVISIFFMVLLLFHVVLHWKMIVSFSQQAVQSKAIRISVAMFLTFFGLVILFYPFFITPKQVPAEPKYRNRNNDILPSSNIDYGIIPLENFPVQQTEIIKNEIIGSEKNYSENKEYEEFQVYGYQTLKFVAQKYKVPVSQIARDLDIPENLSGERLSKLKKLYSFTMTDVRKSIADYKKRQ
ncbi:MAG: DUF4405 domain-containing protein [Bacteroidales bacterium]|nr:DUF4405 domain-containing protein [Bacteroidales bacterium]